MIFDLSVFPCSSPVRSDKRGAKGNYQVICLATPVRVAINAHVPRDVAGSGSPMADQKASAAELERDDGRGFHRSVGLLSAAAINMTQMVGIGPFITIPLMVATFGDRDAAVSQDRVDQGDHHRPVDCHA